MRKKRCSPTYCRIQRGMQSLLWRVLFEADSVPDTVQVLETVR
jgi:hypothetical protein